ncbi:PAS domain-containing protein [Kamptonema formosum]|uniref:PAS domain-containing protein n=1 Tax=Kamptonema formosum TaxID=331992 RepID=UPI00034684ED|nr:PAS domain-containing protein [Oscillatoria sp. PCC 10802]
MPSRLESCGVALLAVTLGLLLQRLLYPPLALESPFLLFFGSVMVSAWYGGLWAGVLATALAAFASDCFFLSDLSLLVKSPGETLQLCLFVVEGLLISRTVAALKSRPVASVAREQPAGNLTAGGAPAQEALATGETLYRTLAEAMPHFVWTLTAEGTLDYANRQWHEHTGLTVERVNNEGWGIAIHPEDLPRVTEVWAQLQQAGAVTEFECRHRRGDGTYRWFLCRLVPVFDARGEVIKWVGSSTDIDDLKQALAALRESQEHLQAILDNSPAVIHVVDTQNRYLLINRRYENVFRVGVEQITGKSLYEIWPQEIADTLAANNRKVLESGIPLELEEVVPERDGPHTYISIKFPLRDAGGVPYAIGGISTDITQRKKAEEELYRREQAFKALADNSPDVIARFDREFRYVYANPVAERTAGIGSKTCIGKTFSELGIPQEKVVEWNQNLQQVFTAGRELVLEEDFPTPSGTRYYQSFLVPEFAKDGSVDSVLCVSREITALKQAKAALQQQAEKLAEANRLKDEFVAVVSHELRSPASAMLGWINFIRRHNFEREAVSRGLDIIERNGKLQFQIINDLLDLSSIIQGQLRIHTCLLNLEPIINAAIEVVRPAAEAKRIQLESAVDLSAGKVIGDPARLQQVLWNLLSNAVKFTPEGGEVFVRCRRIHSRIEISVSDTGCGISPDFLPHVFDRFTQGKNANLKNSSGLGLGLAIVRNLVEMQGGTVSASSSPGRGATFTVQFPVAAIAIKPKNVAVQRLVSPAGRQAPAGSPGALQGVKLLVVDNCPDTCELIATVLEQLGAEVTVAVSAGEALDRLQQFKPDVLVSDLEMPGESGYNFIRRVRVLEAARGGKIPAIALTAHAEPEARLQAFSAGFQMYLTKPAEPDELAAVVASLAALGRN